MKFFQINFYPLKKLKHIKILEYYSLKHSSWSNSQLLTPEQRKYKMIEDNKFP